jgi:hypothetical protein
MAPDLLLGCRVKPSSIVPVLLAGSLLCGCEAAIEAGDPALVDWGMQHASAGGGTHSGAGGGSSGVGGGGLVIPPELPAFEPATLQTRVLLASEYKNAIRDILGTAAATAVTPPPDAALNGLTAIGAAQLSISATTASLYEQNAFLAVQAALKDPAGKAKLIPCTPASMNDAVCAGKILDGPARRIFRRPLTAAERVTWLKVFNDAAAAYSQFEGGVEFLIAGLLQSPNFLYRPEAGDGLSGHVKLSGYEIATRLSFFLSGTTPSDALLAAAEAGQLDTADGIRKQARALLASAPSARAATLAFFGELLGHDGLATLAKDSNAFPGFTAATATSMRDESQLFLQDVLFDRGDVRGLFDANYTFVDTRLAPLYGLTQPGAGFVKVLLPAEQERSGLLTQTAFLSLMAHPASTSPTYRGKFVREKLLCETVAAPPANVNTNLPANNPNTPQTLRQKLASHMTNAACASCHKSMDPIGFGLEGFDAIGRARTLDNGLPVDTSGSLDGHAFANASGLGRVLKNDPRVMKCLARSLFRHATGHVDLPGEARPIEGAYEVFAESGYQYQTLLVELAASDAFRYGRAPEGAVR